MSKIDKYANLYDNDGNLIEHAELHSKSIEEVEELVDNLAKKAEENPENELYKVYLANAQKYLFTLYNGMDRASLIKRMSVLQNSIEEAKNAASESVKEELAETNDAIDKLKEAVDEMDSYVPFEEVKEDE